MANATSHRKDPLTSFLFSVDGIGPQAVFTEVTGLSVEIMVQDYEEGGRNDHIHRLPGRAKVSDITLRNGIVTGDELWEWFKKIMRGNFERRNISIISMDNSFREAERWSFIEALPVKWTGPEFKSGQSAPAIQSLQLTHKGMQID